MTKQRPIRERFPPPWRIEEMPAGLRLVDKNGTALAYVYASDGRAQTTMSTALKPSEARALAPFLSFNTCPKGAAILRARRPEYIPRLPPQT